MNFSRGFFRLWLVLSIVWTALWFLAMRPDQAYFEYRRAYSAAVSAANAAQTVKEENGSEALWEAHLEKLEREHQKVERSKAAITEFAAIGPVVSLFVLLFGSALMWAVQGFRGS